MSTAYILLGSNLGDRYSVLDKAVEIIGREVGRPVSLSSLYETEPSGFISDDRFLNQVVAVETEMFPEELLDALLLIEKRLGRVRLTDRPEYDADGNRVYRSRVIDLDILLYDDMVISTERLEVPHPRMCGRPFTMIPLNEIASGLEIPGTGRTVADIVCNDFTAADAEGVVRLK